MFSNELSLNSLDVGFVLEEDWGSGVYAVTFAGMCVNLFSECIESHSPILVFSVLAHFRFIECKISPFNYKGLR